jgi:hypothetical protein
MQALWLPAKTLQKSVSSPGMHICGMATLDDTIDLDQQLLQTSGVIDSLAYLERFGKLNWNHGGDPEDILGEITKAEIRKALGKKGLYVEAKLNPRNPKAVHAYELMKGGARFGFSVQGVTLRLSKATHNGFPVEKIDEAFVSQVALTGEPKNYNTFAQVLKSLSARTIDKSLTAGTGTDSSTFTGGRALTKESMGVPNEETLRLARHFHQVHGRKPRELEKSVAVFSQTWQLSPSVRERLAEHLRRS